MRSTLHWSVLCRAEPHLTWHEPVAGQVAVPGVLDDRVDLLRERSEGGDVRVNWVVEHGDLNRLTLFGHGMDRLDPNHLALILCVCHQNLFLSINKKFPQPHTSIEGSHILQALKMIYC